MDVEVKDPLPVVIIARPMRMFDVGASLRKTLEIKRRKGNFFMRQQTRFQLTHPRRD